jgi:hypothetical protein
MKVGLYKLDDAGARISLGVFDNEDLLVAYLNQDKKAGNYESKVELHSYTVAVSEVQKVDIQVTPAP